MIASGIVYNSVFIHQEAYNHFCPLNPPLLGVFIFKT